MPDNVTSILRLSDFRSALESSGLAKWDVDPTGPKRIKISTKEEKYGVMPAGEGFFLPGGTEFFLCYEFYKGVAVHLNGDVAAENLLKQLAKELDANAFFID